MAFLIRFIFCIALTSVSACSALIPAAVDMGDSEAEVLAKRGEPTRRHHDGNDLLLEYATAPWGQHTYMVRLDPSRKVISFEQVLTTQKFGTIKIDEATKNDVLITIGSPSEISYLYLSDLEVWSYPYKENGVWDSIMHVHFDRQGIVRKMLNGPDPRFDPDDRFPFGMLRW